MYMTYVMRNKKTIVIVVVDNPSPVMFGRSTKCKQLESDRDAKYSTVHNQIKLIRSATAPEPDIN